jgi:MFS family permease
MVQAIFRREIIPWALLGLTLGLVEGATAAVVLKHGFAGAAPAAAVNMAVAFVSGAPALSNVVSFVWSNLAHGRGRVQLLVALQSIFAVLVGLIGLAPQHGGGLLFAVGSVLCARVAWSGVLTIRSVVWTVNYPRNLIARITGRVVIVSSLAVAAAAAIAASVIERRFLETRLLYAGAALAGLCGAWLFRATRVRREHRLLAEEASAASRGQTFSLRMFTTILREDPAFREYMFWMGLFGAGNLMLTSQLVVILSDQFALPSAIQIAVLAVVPLVTLPLFVPFWARMFDGEHVVVYRSRQGWALVAAVAVMCLATYIGYMPLLWVGAVLLGLANAGANLGWNLGHNDFAAIGRAQHYMGVHVTLTGVRGMIAPPLGIAIYQVLESLHAGAGKLSLILPLALTAAGAGGFTAMRRRFNLEQT